MEGLVAVVTQYLVGWLVLPSTHTARTHLALAAMVVATVAAVWFLLTRLSLFIWSCRWNGRMTE